MADNLDEYRAKLAKSRQQLKKVKQFITQQPHNESLLNLKKDLEEVITVTENLIKKKQEKSYDPAKSKTNKHKNNSSKTGYQSHNSNNNNNNNNRQHNNSNNSNMYANNPMFIQNNNTKNNDKQNKKTIPREWGIKKEHYEIGERCQVKWNRKWYIAKILGCIEPPPKLKPDKKTDDDGGEQTESPLQYRVWFLNHGSESIVSQNNVRTYVPPLMSELAIGMKIRGIWYRDGKFYPAQIEEILDNGANYKIKFFKYNEYSIISLYDIQLISHNKSSIGINDLGFGIINTTNHIISKDKQTGNLRISQSAIIPSYLWSSADDTPLEREKKRKKIRSIKKQHRSLKLNIESKNRANNWLKFKTKSLKKSKKKLKSTLLTKDKEKSIFESTNINNNNSFVDNNMTSFKQRTHFHHLRKDPKHYKNINNSK